ncbi:hypothetical protein AVEN_69478-1 [Araneus ventricosus]|uniref:Transposase Tc1-like domain-containing protein n=1 Tax=Araneus ventricosus TaxID=182803 RepID=A0A4Y2KZX1_ARAVE|nr:hypothetical protein AVEN_69478-1 [Araneus ventricosus]
MDFGSRRPTRVPLLNARHRAAWAREHREWTLEDWKRVAWSDESRLWLLHADGRLRLWRQAHETKDPACQDGIVHSQKFRNFTAIAHHFYGQRPLFPFYGNNPYIVVRMFLILRSNTVIFASVITDAFHWSIGMTYQPEDEEAGKIRRHLTIFSVGISVPMSSTPDFSEEVLDQVLIN